MISTIIFTFLIGIFLPPKITPHEQLLPITSNGKIGFINLKGKIIIPPKFRSVGKFSGGLAPARLEGLYGYIDQKGDYIIPPVYVYAKEFDQGRATVYDSNGKELIIDRTGKRISDTAKTQAAIDPYDWQMSTPPKAEISFTEPFTIKSDTLVKIDEAGNILHKYPDIFIGNASHKLSYVHGIMTIHNITSKNERKVLNYILDSNGKILYSSYDEYFQYTKNPRYILSGSHLIDLKTKQIIYFSDRSYNSFTSDDYCLRGFKKDTMAYFGYDGKKIWEEEEVEDPYRSFHFNVDRQTSPPYRLASTDMKFTYRSDPLLFGDAVKPDTGISVIAAGVETFTDGASHKNFSALKIILVNNTSENIRTRDISNFYMQARDRNGIWKDIEGINGFFCGTGIRHVSIPPKKFVVFAGPVYEGSMKTKLRVKFEDSIYSNEFDGSVNPGQFWKE